ncbi:hypothetical protein L6164_031597 [Bauhinia variegata]|uniref:Uncharacterized protein n=1 Tax=Bauhinia variegata TaxID=167791 RepID=A0ACB9LFY9_BAUVA|nr:hypothetical protein L6164_031597 [Bauhinia variegata]
MASETEPTTSNVTGKEEPKKEWLEDMRGSLSMVATLIATITFQVALNPPGGVVQTSTGSNVTTIGCNGMNITTASNTSFPLNTTSVISNDTICTGEAVLAGYASSEQAYRWFLRGSTFSFVSSLSVALLLVSGIPLRHRFPIWLLSVTMSASLTSLAFTFVLGVILLSPNGIYNEEDHNFTIVMGTWIGLLVLVMLFNTTRFVVWLVKTFCGNESTANCGQSRN